MDPRALNDSQGTDLHAPSHDNGTTSTAAGGMQPGEWDSGTGDDPEAPLVHASKITRS